MAGKGPRPWKLSEEESFASFTSRQHNFLYHLGRDESFKPYVTPGPDGNYPTWNKYYAANQTRSFLDTEHRLMAAQKAAQLAEMLGYIIQWVPHYLANDIIKSSTSISTIWQFIRKYYG